MALDPQQINQYTQDFAHCRANRVARNAVTSSNIMPVARDITALRNYHDTYGIKLNAGAMTNQRKSGRCWLFSTYNVLRAHTMKKLDVKTIEFSQAYGMFYDKLEKANATLARIIETAQKPWDDREVMWMLEHGMGDGGYYNFGRNLVEKWGVVPVEIMPETACSKDSAQLNAMLERLVRKYAYELRTSSSAGQSLEELTERKNQMMKDVHKLLCTCLGEPPLTFDFICEVGAHADVDATKVQVQEGNNDEVRILRDRQLTPQEFARRYVIEGTSDYVALICFPGADRPLNTVYHLKATDNIEGAEPLRFVNTTMEVLEQAAIASLKAGEPVWMGCDVMQQFPRYVEDGAKAMLTLDVADIDSVFGLDMSMSREAMVDARETSLTHAMTFQGVELNEDGTPKAWRIENSWGEEYGNKGYLISSAAWFRTYGGEVDVKREFVPQELLDLWDNAEAQEVYPWHNLGAALSPRQ